MDPTHIGIMTRPGVEVSGSDRPRLARYVRLSFCRTRQRHILQLPYTVVVLHGSGADVLGLCDGRRTVAEIVETASLLRIPSLRRARVRVPKLAC